MSRAAVLLSFFFTGFAGLIDQVVWVRLFQSAIGGSPGSLDVLTLTVLGGMALGALLGGALADRARLPLRLGGLFLLMAGLLSALFPSLLAGAGRVLEAIYRLHDGEPSHPVFTVARAILPAAALLPLSGLLGALLPLFVRHLVRQAGEAGAWAGSLLALGGLGGWVGAVFATFVLFPVAGVAGSGFLAAAIHGLVGAFLVLGSRRGPAASAGDALAPGPAAAAAETMDPDPLRRRLLLALLGVGGGLAMVLFLSWKRVVVLTLGNTLQAPLVAAGVVLLGLALGSMIAAAFADRIRRPLAALGWVITGAAGLACVTIPALGVFPTEFGQWLGRLRVSMSFPLYLVLGALWTSALILPSAVFLGMALPLSVRARVSPREGVGRSVGAICFAGLLGAMAGAFLLRFVILPLSGRLWAPLYIAAGCGLGLALVLLRLERRGAARSWLPRMEAAVFAILAMALALFSYSHRPFGVLDGGSPERQERYWAPVTLSLGPLLYHKLAGLAASVEDLERENAGTYQTLFYRDGPARSVGVFQLKDSDLQWMRVDGKVEATSGSGSMDLPAPLLSGHLPMLARGGARQVLVVGLGNGVAAGAMSLYRDVESITCFEASAEVAEGARAFQAVNHGACGNTRVRIVIADGRSHLRATASRYDVICVQLSSFWTAGVGSLFTREFYASALDRLAPGGVFCQRVQGSRVRSWDLRTALRTFARAFPHATLWTAGEDLLFLGSREPPAWRPQWMAEALAAEEVGKDLARVGVDRPEALFRHLCLPEGALLSLAGEGPDNREAFPLLECWGPFGLFDLINEVPLLLAGAPPLPQGGPLSGFSATALEEVESYRGRGAMLRALENQLVARRLEAASALLPKIAAQRDPWLAQGAAQLVSRHSMIGPENERRLLLTRALLVLSDPTIVSVYRMLPAGKLDRKLLQRAGKEALQADWTAHVLLAQESLDRSQAEEALKYAKEAEARGAPGDRLGQIRGVAYALQGDLDSAERSFHEALAAAPVGDRGEIYYNLGRAREQRKDYARAIEYQQKSLAEGADLVRGKVALARCLRVSGRASEAFQAAEEASKNPKKRESAEAFYEAALALLDLGNPKAALGWMAEAAAASPERYKESLERLEKAAK